MKSKEYKLRILPLFEKDLYDATDYIRYNLNNPHAAAKLIDDVMEVRRLIYNKRQINIHI